MGMRGKIEVEFLAADGQVLDRLELEAPAFDGTVWIKVDQAKVARSDVAMVRARLIPQRGTAPGGLKLELLPVAAPGSAGRREPQV